MTEPHPAETVVRAARARIRADREHGASWLAREAARAISHAAEVALSGQASAAEGVPSGEQWRHLLRDLAYARPSMAALAVTVARIYAAGYRERATDDGRAALETIRAEAERLANDWDTSASAIAEYARPLLAGVVLTHSRSGTVEHVLLHLASAESSLLERVIVTTSQPGGEGVATARVLAAAGLAVTLVADAAIGLAAAEANCVVLGADSLRGDGSLVNKVGSYPIALAARAARIPVYVLAESLKIAPDGWPLRLEEGDPAMLLPAPPPGVSVRVTLFDHTPATLLARIVTERGMLRPDELRPFGERTARDLTLLDTASDA